MAAEVCPRCQESFIPNNLNPGGFPGALSRVDNETYICSLCGEDEAIGNMNALPVGETGIAIDGRSIGRLIPKSQWPTKPTEFTLRMARMGEFARARLMLERGP